jgi:hypothetical protein
MLSAPYMWGYKLNINPNMWWYMKMAKVQQEQCCVTPAKRS